MNNKAKYGVFYKSQGLWTPLRTNIKRKQKTFTSTREMERFINSREFIFYKNCILKSAVTVRRVK